MDFSLLTRHRGLLAFVMLVLGLALTLCVTNGQLKDIAEVEWLDVVGEGSICLLTLCWITAVMISRPPGKVTALLVAGLSFFNFSAMLDVFD